MSSFKTALLFIILTLIFIFAGYMVGGRGGITIAFALALMMNLGAYWFSDKMVLAMYRARQIGEADDPRLFRIIRSASQMAGLPMPRVYIVPASSANAFATGRNPQHAAVAVTEGILRLLGDDELTGVVAHELAHIRNRDTLVGAVAATIAGAISYLAFMARWMPFLGGGDDDDSGAGGLVALLVIGILAPIAAAMVQMAISRQREFMADRTAAQISRKPLSLASALRKLSDAGKRTPLRSNPATAHLFIVSPLMTRKDLAALFSTHPPVEERIARLQKLARDGP